MTVDPSYGLQLELRPKRPRWGPWATLGWGIVIALSYLATQLGAALGFVFWWESQFAEEPLNLAELGTNGPLLGTVTILSSLAAVAAVLLAVKLSRVSAREYLALKWPTWRYLLIGLAITAIMLPAVDFVTAQSGRDTVPDFMTDIYVSSQSAGPAFSVLLAFTLIVVAPLGEEIVFRGFFFRGLANGFGPFMAIVITSVIWAGMHVQYDPFFMTQVAVFGLALGWLRWRSGSLPLAMAVHAIINALALAQVSVITGA